MAPLRLNRYTPSVRLLGGPRRWTGSGTVPGRSGCTGGPRPSTRPPGTSSLGTRAARSRSEPPMCGAGTAGPRSARRVRGCTPPTCSSRSAVSGGKTVSGLGLEEPAGVHHRAASAGGQDARRPRPDDRPRWRRCSTPRSPGYQLLGVVHFHALIRLDGLKTTHGSTPAPATMNARLLARRVERAARTVRLTVPGVDGLGGTTRSGARVRPAA